MTDNPHSKIISDYRNEIGDAFTDSLTGLFNHGFFQISLEREINRYSREGKSFSLALIGIDSFRFFNKQQGSMKGDAILKDMSGLITQNLRKIDLAARYTGDEFAIILVKSKKDSAFIALERIRKAIETKFGKNPTVSSGIACYPDDATSKEILVKVAQKALLKAKVTGKNKTFYYDNLQHTDAQTGDLPKVLIVDDDPSNLKLLEASLHPLGYDVFKASNGEEISIVARIVAVVDTYDALVTDRPYRKKMEKREAVNILLEEAGRGRLDKNVTQLMVDKFDK